MTRTFLGRCLAVGTNTCDTVDFRAIFVMGQAMNVTFSLFRSINVPSVNACEHGARSVSLHIYVYGPQQCGLLNVTGFRRSLESMETWHAYRHIVATAPFPVPFFQSQRWSWNLIRLKFLKVQRSRAFPRHEHCKSP